MHNNVLLATTNGYMFVNGKLMAYEFKSAIVNFSNGEVEYTCILGGEQKTIKTTEFLDVYKDEDSFKAGDYINGKNLTWADAICGAFFYMGSSINDSGECTMYVVRNNEVISAPAPTDGFVYKGCRTSHPAKGEFYQTREEALLHCDLIVVDEKGVETTTLSPAKRVALTDEQKEAVKALEMAFKRVEALGVGIVCDNCNDFLYAYNDKDVKCKEYGWSSGDICEHGYRINDLMTPTNMSVIAISLDDTSMHVKFED